MPQIGKNSICIFLISTLFLITIHSVAFAENQASSDIGSISTSDKIYYNNTNMIKIFGNVTEYRQGDKLTIVITDPDGEIGGSQLFPTSSGYYETFHVIKENSLLGDYKIDASYRNKIIGTIYFELVAFNPIASEPVVEQEPVIEETPKPVIEEKPVVEQKPNVKPILSFVDHSKDPAHYVKRYVNEPKYKDWFDSQFPNYTIWEGIGISETQYRNIIRESINNNKTSDVVSEVESILNELFPTRKQFDSEWRSPTNKRVIDEIERTRELVPSSFEGYVEHGWRGYMKNQGSFEQNHLDLYIYRFDSTVNAESFWSNHVDFWENRGGYKKWSPSTRDVNADGCFGRTIQGMMWDKLSLYCQKDKIVTVVSAAGSEWEIKDEVNDFSDAVFDNLEKIQKKSESVSTSDDILGGFSSIDNQYLGLERFPTTDAPVIILLLFGTIIATPVMGVYILKKRTKKDPNISLSLPGKILLVIGGVMLFAGQILLPFPYGFLSWIPFILSGLVILVIDSKKKSEITLPHVEYSKRARASERTSLLLSCQKCNSPLHENEKFCGKCGSSTVPEPAIRQGLVCRSCKNKLKPNEKFCGKCGSSNT